MRSRTHSNVFGGDDHFSMGSSSSAVTDSVSKSRRKRTRDTWCPGSLGVPLPSINISSTASSANLPLQSQTSNRVSSGTTLSSTDSELAAVEEADEADGIDGKFEDPICAQCEENQTERAALVTSILAKDEEINQFKSACSTHEAQLKSLEQQLVEAMNKNGDKESLLAAISEKEEQISELLSTCAELEKQCETLNQRLEAEVTNSYSIKNDNLALMDEVKCKKYEHQESLNENVRLLQSIEEKELQMQQLQESLSDTESKLLDLQQYMDQNSSELHEEVQRKEQEIIELRLNLETKTSELDDSKASMSKDIQRLETAVEDMKRDLEEKSIYLLEAQSQQEVLNQQLEVEMGANAEFQRERDSEVQQLVETQQEKQRTIELLLQENNQKLDEFNQFKQLQQVVVSELENQLAEKQREYMERIARLEMTFLDAQQASITEADSKIADLESQLGAAKIKSALDEEVIALSKEKVISLEEMLTNSNAASELLKLSMKELEALVQESKASQEQMIISVSEAELENTALGEKLAAADEKLESSIQESQATIVALSAEVASLKLEITGVHNSYTVEKERMLSEWSRDRETLQQSSDETKLQIENLSSQLEALTKENEQQIAQIQKFHQAQQSRMSMLSHQTNLSEISITQESIDGARREMEKQIEAMRAELGNREGEISKLLFSNADLQNRLNSAEQAINSTLNKEISSHDGEAALRKRCGQLQTCVDLLKGEKDTLQSKCNQLEGKLKSNSNRLESEVEDLQRKLNSQLQAAEKMQAEISNIASLRDSNIHLERSLTELKKDRDSIAAERLQLRKECTNLTDQLMATSEKENHNDQLDLLQSQLHSAQEKEAQLCREKQALEEDIRELSSRAKKAKEDANLMKSEWMSIETELTSAKKESQSLRKDLELSLQQITALTEALEKKESTQQLDANNVDRQEEFETMQHQVSELIEEVKYQQEVIARLQLTIGERDKQIECVENALLDVNSSLQVAQNTIEVSKDLQDKLDLSTAEVQSLRDEMSTSTAESQTNHLLLQQTLEKLQSQLVASTNNLNQLNDEREEEVELLQGEKLALEEKNSTLQTDLAMAVDKIAIKEEEGKLLMLRISLTEEELEDQKAIVLKNMDSMKVLNDEVSFLYESVNRLKSELEIAELDSKCPSLDKDFEILCTAIKERFATYEQRIISSQDQLAAFEAQANQAAELSQLEAELKTELEVCKKQLTEAENSLAQNSVENESQIIQLQIDLQAQNKAYNDLTTELANRANSLVELQLQLEDLQAEKERECFELTEEILSLQRDNEAAVSQHLLVLTECEQKQLEISSLQNGMKDSNSAVEEARCKLALNEEEILNLRSRLETLERERDSAAQQLSIFENESMDKEVQSKHVVELEKKIGELEGDVLRLRELQKESERQYVELEEELLASDERVQTAVRDLEAEKQISSDKISSLESELTATLRKLERTEVEMDTLSTQLLNKHSEVRTLCEEKDEEIAALSLKLAKNDAEQCTLISQIRDLKQSLASSTAELATQSEQSAKTLQNLKVEVAQLRRANAEREDAMAQIENELYELKQEQAQAISSAVEESVKELKSAKSAAKELTTMLRARDNDLQSMQEHCTTVEEMLTSLRADIKNQLELKDKRIAHLETSKLTQEQLQRIVVMKEERKKFQEDAKTLKKQLARLKTAYDDLKEKQLESAEAASKTTSSSSDFVISDLKFQVAEVTAQLTQSQAISQTLKDKLRDCAKQLQVRVLVRFILRITFLIFMIVSGI